MSKSRISNSGNSAEGLLIIFSAPSGCGKTTIVDRLLKRHSDWVRSISVTTRAPRQGENEGEDYFFVSPDEFKKMESRGEFLESAQVFESSYGTPHRFVEEQLKASKTVLMTIDVQGTLKVKKTAGKSLPIVTIFVLPPSVKVLRERLESRKTEDPKEIERRILLAQDEIKEAGWYDCTVVNQNLDQTIVEIETFIEKIKMERSQK